MPVGLAATENFAAASRPKISVSAMAFMDGTGAYRFRGVPPGKYLTNVRIEAVRRLGYRLEVAEG